MQALLLQIFDNMIVNRSASGFQSKDCSIQHSVILHQYGEVMIIVHQLGDFFLVIWELGENVVMMFKHFSCPFSESLPPPGIFRRRFFTDMASA